jgi:hypothetical protein
MKATTNNQQKGGAGHEGPATRSIGKGIRAKMRQTENKEDEKMKEIECDVCDEAILESEERFGVVITNHEGIVMEGVTVCENCKDEVMKALGHSTLRR